jgi:hypothetical protein
MPGRHAGVVVGVVGLVVIGVTVVGVIVTG